MELVFTVLRFVILLVSCLGYMLLARDKLAIQPKFAWIFVFSCITCIVYIAGLAKLLSYAAYACFFIGIVLFAYYFIVRKQGLLFELKALNLLNISFCIGFGIIFASLINTNYMHYDNFSHWGLVVKYMLITNHIPDAGSAIIDFKTYPLGSSIFLYYVCKIAGNTEGVMLVAQAMLIFACFYAMFGIIRNPKRFLLCSVLALCGAMMTFYNISIRINNLLVDFIMPLLALAVLSILFVYRHDVKRACIISTPILAMLVLVKNSALFFAIICYIYLLYVGVRSRKRENKVRSLMLALAAILISLSTLIAWNVHVSAEFKGENSKHSVSLENFNEVSSAKTPEIKAEIVKRYVKAVFSWSSLATCGIVLFQLLALAAYVAARLLHKQWALLKVLLWIDLVIILYYAGILAMFIFTMPTEEALDLAGFERYASSVVILLIGVLGICLVHDMENSFHVQLSDKRDYMAFKSLLSKHVYETATIGLIALSVTILLSEVNGMTSMKDSYNESLPGRVRQLVGDHWQGRDEHKYLFYASDAESQVTSFYLQYTAKYFLFTPHVDAIDTLEADSLSKKLADYDYFVVLEADAAIADFMGEYGVNPENVTGIYAVTDTFK